MQEPLLVEPRFVTGTVACAALTDLKEGEIASASTSVNAVQGIALADARKAQRKSYKLSENENVALQVMGVATVREPNSLQGEKKLTSGRQREIGMAQGFDFNSQGTILSKHRTLLHPVYTFVSNGGYHSKLLLFQDLPSLDAVVKVAKTPHAYHPYDVMSCISGYEATVDTVKGLAKEGAQIYGGAETDGDPEYGQFKLGILRRDRATKFSSNKLIIPPSDARTHAFEKDADNWAEPVGGLSDVPERVAKDFYGKNMISMYGGDASTYNDISYWKISDDNAFDYEDYAYANSNVLQFKVKAQKLSFERASGDTDDGESTTYALQTESELTMAVRRLNGSTLLYYLNREGAGSGGTYQPMYLHNMCEQKTSVPDSEE